MSAADTQALVDRLRQGGQVARAAADALEALGELHAVYLTFKEGSGPWDGESARLRLLGFTAANETHNGAIHHVDVSSTATNHTSVSRTLIPLTAVTAVHMGGDYTETGDPVRLSITIGHTGTSSSVSASRSGFRVTATVGLPLADPDALLDFERTISTAALRRRPS